MLNENGFHQTKFEPQKLECVYRNVMQLLVIQEAIASNP